MTPRRLGLRGLPELDGYRPAPNRLARLRMRLADQAVALNVAQSHARRLRSARARRDLPLPDLRRLRHTGCESRGRVNERGLRRGGERGRQGPVRRARRWATRLLEARGGALSRDGRNPRGASHLERGRFPASSCMRVGTVVARLDEHERRRVPVRVERPALPVHAGQVELRCFGSKGHAHSRTS